MSRLLRGRSRSCWLSSPTATAGLSSHDVVEGFGRDGHRLGHRAELEPGVDAGHAAGPHHHAGLLELLEGGGDDLDAIGAGSQVRRLEATLVVGVDAARHPGRLVDDQDGGGRDGRSLRVGDGATQSAEDRLGVRGDDGDRDCQEHQYEHAPRQEAALSPRALMNGCRRISSSSASRPLPGNTLGRPGKPRPPGSRSARYERKRQLVELSSPFLFVCQCLFLLIASLRDGPRPAYRASEP